jgi:dihydrofolate synthase / folylpolyglutamate synthase
MSSAHGVPDAGWVRYLDSLAVFGMKPGLERVSWLLTALGEPQQSFRSVHVVGTNGKSSTTRYVEGLLRAHGLLSGAYLSPHISGYEERIIVDGRSVSAAAFGSAVERVRAASAGLPPESDPATQFEVLTVAAFLAMADLGVEAAAIEAGLGGRLDATNVLHAPVVVLTNVRLEHTEVLGDTREAIFAEKAAVIRGGDAVFGELDGLEPLAREACAATGARLHALDDDVLVTGRPDDFVVDVRVRPAHVYRRLRVPTPARYQTRNAALAVAAAHLLLGGLDPGRVRTGLAAVEVPGRLQVVRRHPLVIADGAHNAPGMTTMVASLAALERPRPRVALLAILRDKRVDEMLATLLPLVDAVVCTRAHEPRCLSAEEVAAHVRDHGLEPVATIDDPVEAYAAALRAAGPDGSLLVTGSLYLLEDLAGVLTRRPGGRAQGYTSDS